MDPNKFFEFAEFLENSTTNIVDDETDSRTGIGRTQYSIFLKYRGEIRNKIQSINPILAQIYIQNERTKIHGIIPEILRICDPTIRNQYGVLRNKRNIADYNMRVVISKKDLQWANKIARQLDNNISVIKGTPMNYKQIQTIFKKCKIKI